MNGSIGITVLGTVCKVRELRYTANGNAVLDFTVVVNRDVNTTNEAGEKDRQQEALYVKFTAWNASAEMLVKSLSSGNKEAGISASVIQVETDWIRVDTWKGEDGNMRYDLVATARKVTFVTGGLYGKGAGAGKENAGPARGETAREDIPF